MLLNCAMIKALITWTPISPRLLTARLRHKRGALTVVVAYAPTELADAQTKDAFYDQLCAAVSSAPPHDLLYVLGDLNATTSSDPTLFPNVVGNYGSGTLNDNSERMLTFCAAHGLAALRLWFRRKDIWRWTWISNDGRTRKELDHVLTNCRALAKSYRVYRGAEAPANTDHRLVVTEVSLAFVPTAKRRTPPKYNVQRLVTDETVRSAYNNSLQARLHPIVPSVDDVEVTWAQLSASIHASATNTVGFVRSRRRPWITDETLEAVDQKAAARLAGGRAEWRRLCSVVRARTKADRERYYNQLADDAESGIQNNQLKAVYRAIKEISGKASSS